MRPHRGSMVNVADFLSAGQAALLERIPETGDILDLDAAVAILARTEPHAYGALVTLMNKGIVSADFVDTSYVDPEIVIRRL
ncbi:hypothetical protein [Aureimonas sp. Leaf324]|uniref:hypothetical protein n=1 Tax=Aureimonas sp. Leaf324 TaxID=1736336 RepID=UPI0012E2C2FE|nr:hypothetical protein [Aureimonas sp. Leaf324]